MSQKLPVNRLKWIEDLSEFNERFIKFIMKIVIEDIFLKQMLSIRKILIKIYHFQLKEKKIEKVKKLVCDIEDRTKYVMHIRALKQALNHGLILKRVHRVIQFNQRAWLKRYIDMNTGLRKEVKNKKKLFRKFVGNRNENNKSKNE